MNNEGTAGIPLRFSLSNRALKFRDILNKNFIELEVWAISDINPNRNKSHFTLESLEKAVERGEFFNKPIVGFFEKNDFTTHEGRASYDPEVDKTYWDTTKGERILGWVRSQDKVELVEDTDGLHWVKFTCILYTRYCYQQVKRLLKDRHKDVSVEINVHDSDMVDGIRYIKDFTLEGVAILGSKNGKTIIPGIPDAHLTVLDTEGNEELAAQYKELAFAYESMDSDGVQDKQNGEGETPLVPDDLQGKEDQEAKMEQNVNFEEGYRISLDKSKEAMSDKPWGEVDKSELKDKVIGATNFKEVADDIFLDLREGWEDGVKDALKYPVMLVKEDNTAVYNRDALASAKAYATTNNEEEVLKRIKAIYEDLELNEEEDEALMCGGDPACCAAEGEEPAEGCCQLSEADGEGDAVACATDDPTDTCAAEPEGEPAPVVEESVDELKGKLEETKTMCEQLQIALEACEAEKNLFKTELHDALERATKAEAALAEMSAKAETLERDLHEADEKIHQYYCEDLKRTAELLMENEKIAAADRAAILEKCEKGEYACDEDIRKDVAYAAYNARPADERRFSVSIESPAHTDAENKKQTLTREQRIAARYAGKNN